MSKNDGVASDYPIPESWTKDQRGAPGERRPPEPLKVDERTLAEKVFERGVLRCSSCGEQMNDATPPHQVETRIVKPRNNYGGARELTAVYIEPRHIDANVRNATMSLDELRMIEARMRTPVQQDKPRLLQAVESSLEATAAQTRAQIARAKEQHELDMRRALQRERDLLNRSDPNFDLSDERAGGDIARQRPPIDQQQSSQPIRPVDEDPER